MQKLIWAFIPFLCLVSACGTPTSLPAIVTETLSPAPSPSSTTPALTVPPPVGPTFTLSPTFIPLKPTDSVTRTPIPFPSATATPEGPRVQSLDKTLCHIGPAREYAPQMPLEAGQSVEIVGVNETGGWWYVRVQKESGAFVNCWVSQKSVAASGELSSVPVTESAPAQVTAINIYLDGEYTREVNCRDKGDQPTFHFRGEIVANGPLEKLKYTWETNAGQKFTPEMGQIRAYDEPRMLKLDLTVPAREGTYALTLRSLFPNEVVWVAQFVVKCK